MQKLNMTIGRFQPFTQGHLNMVNEGDGPCIVFRINSSNKMPDSIKGFKVSGRVVKRGSVENVIKYLDGEYIELSEQEKELLKRPFTNELIDKELEIIRRSNKNIVKVVPVINMFHALALFNKFLLDNKDKYEPGLLMCGDDRVDNYTELINKYDELEIERGGEKFPSVIKGKLVASTGKGRTEGVSGTAVRKAIITNDKSAFEKIMPKGTGVMFDDFVDAFDTFKEKLQGMIKESYISLSEYILENIKND